MDTDTLHAHSAGLESWSKQCHTLLDSAWIDAACCTSLRLERVCVSLWLFFQHPIVENGLIAGGKQSKEGRHSIIFTLPNPFPENPDEFAPSDDFTIHKKVHYHSNMKHDQNAVRWVKLSRAQGQGLRFWQMSSSPTIGHNLVPADCMYRVISQNLRTEIEQISKDSTPRPAPTLAFSWHSQQQQQPLNGSVSSCSRKLERNSVSLVDKSQTRKSIFLWKGYLKIPSWKRKNRWKKSTKSWRSWKLIRSCTKSIRNDLRKGNMIFSEESSHAIYAMGYMELLELRQTSATIQCLSCLQRIPEWLNIWVWGFWLRPDQHTVGRMYDRFAALVSPYCRATI